jgi:hypothetical protein
VPLTPNAPLTNSRTYEVQRWLQKKLSISHSGRNSPSALILRLIPNLSPSQNRLLS